MRVREASVGVGDRPSETEIVAGADGYPLHVRVWRPSHPTASVVMLHGLISHSDWLSPVAGRLADSGVMSICPDRRGSGANPAPRGDAPSGDALLEDLDRVVCQFTASGSQPHLAGFCWGAAYAVNYAARRRRRAGRKEVHTVRGEHGVQFDAADDVATLLYRWVMAPVRGPSA